MIMEATTSSAIWQDAAAARSAPSSECRQHLFRLLDRAVAAWRRPARRRERLSVVGLRRSNNEPE